MYVTFFIQHLDHNAEVNKRNLTMTFKPLPPGAQRKSNSAANKRHLCVYVREEFGSVSYIVCNSTRQNKDFKKCSKLLHNCDADCCCIY